MDKPSLIIRKVFSKSEIPFELLTMADPSLDQIKMYLDIENCFIGKIGYTTVGVLALKRINHVCLEIKNIAVEQNYQNQGIGKKLLIFAEQRAIKHGFRKLLVGTGNSSIKPLGLYQKLGFNTIKIQYDFFIDNYSQPIYENGIQCKDLIILEKSL